MSSYISYQRGPKWSESTGSRFSFWYIAILALIGILIITTIVFSIASCKEQRRLEQERDAIQRSRDSLEQQLLTPSVPASKVPAMENIYQMEKFHPIFFKYQQPVVGVYE